MEHLKLQLIALILASDDLAFLQEMLRQLSEIATPKEPNFLRFAGCVASDERETLASDLNQDFNQIEGEWD